MDNHKKNLLKNVIHIANQEYQLNTLQEGENKIVNTEMLVREYQLRPISQETERTK